MLSFTELELIGDTTIPKPGKQATRLRSQLDIWEAELSLLDSRAVELKPRSRIELEERLDALRAQKNSIATEWRHQHREADGAWRDFQSGLDDAWRHLDNAARFTVSRYGRALEPASR